VLQVRGLARETSIKVSSYGKLFQCCTRSSGQVRRNLRAIGPLSNCVASGGEGGDLQGVTINYQFLITWRSTTIKLRVLKSSQNLFKTLHDRFLIRLPSLMNSADLSVPYIIIISNIPNLISLSSPATSGTTKSL
jgi:hypothetical protein